MKVPYPGRGERTIKNRATMGLRGHKIMPAKKFRAPMAMKGKVNEY